MALMQWDPFTALARLDDEFDQLMRHTWGGASARPTGYVPAIDMVHEGSDVLIRLELPGVDPSRDVNIEVNDRRLVISGERREESTDKDERGRVLVRELRYGAFRREFALPEGVTGEDVEASYDRGMLEVRVRNVAKPEPKPTKVPIRGVTEQPVIESTVTDSGSSEPGSKRD